jgi:hypothetical protein
MVVLLVYFQGYERFKEATDAFKESGWAVISGEASIFGFDRDALFPAI